MRIHLVGLDPVHGWSSSAISRLQDASRQTVTLKKQWLTNDTITPVKCPYVKDSDKSFDTPPGGKPSPPHDYCTKKFI
eukprot:31946-Eustigmatos_ZCMA.PRE.1